MGREIAFHINKVEQHGDTKLQRCAPKLTNNVELPNKRIKLSNACYNLNLNIQASMTTMDEVILICKIKMFPKKERFAKSTNNITDNVDFKVLNNHVINYFYH